MLGHYATHDQWINKQMVSASEAATDEAGKPCISHWYGANHHINTASHLASIKGGTIIGTLTKPFEIEELEGLLQPILDAHDL